MAKKIDPFYRKHFETWADGRHLSRAVKRDMWARFKSDPEYYADAGWQAVLDSIALGKPTPNPHKRNPTATTLNVLHFEKWNRGGRHKWFTKAIARKLPLLGTTSALPAEKVPVVVKLFNPGGAGSWFITEANLQTGEAFGYVTGLGSDELGYMDLNEMRAFKGRMGLPLERDEHFSGTLAEVMDGKKNPRKRNPDRGLIDAIRPGDRVTIVDRFGKERSGKAVIYNAQYQSWTLNMGGAYGTPGIATDANIVKVSPSKKRASGGAMMLAYGPLRGPRDNPDARCQHCGAYASRCHKDEPRRRATICAVSGKVVSRWPKKTRAKNPDAYVIALYMGNKRLTYDAGMNRFSDHARPSLYGTAIAAQDRAQLLLKRNAKLTRYKMTVEKASPKEAGATFGAIPRRRNPKGRGAHTFEVWYPGYQTKVRADSAIEAARMAYGGSVTHVSGSAMGSNPAIYAAADGSGMTIKVWKSRVDNPRPKP